MKRVLWISVTIIFILVVYVYARITVIYQSEDRNVLENNREDYIKITQSDRQVIQEMIKIIHIGTCELKKNMKEQYDVTDKQTYSEQWIDEHVSGIIFEESVTQEDIDRIANMQNLKSLGITVSGNDIDLSPLRRLDKLQELRIFFVTDTDNVDLTFIKELHYLTKIDFNKCTSLKDLSLFKDMIFLQDLSVGYVDDVDLNYLAGCESLENISITGGHIRNAEGFSNLIHVRSINLHDTQPEKEPIMNDLERISNLKGLERVELRFIHVSDTNQLGDLPNLRWIRLVGTGVSDIQPLSNLEQIQILEIYGNKSERVKEQAEMYFNDIEQINVTEDIPNSLSNY